MGLDTVTLVLGAAYVFMLGFLFFAAWIESAQRDSLRKQLIVTAWAWPAIFGVQRLIERPLLRNTVAFLLLTGAAIIFRWWRERGLCPEYLFST